jgi:hypothetical protein
MTKEEVMAFLRTYVDEKDREEVLSLADSLLDRPGALELFDSFRSNLTRGLESVSDQALDHAASICDMVAERLGVRRAGAEECALLIRAFQKTCRQNLEEE